MSAISAVVKNRILKRKLNSWERGSVDRERREAIRKVLRDDDMMAALNDRVGASYDAKIASATAPSDTRPFSATPIQDFIQFIIDNQEAIIAFIMLLIELFGQVDD